MVEFASNAVRTKAPDFVHLGITAINAADELGSSKKPATRVGRPTVGSNWSAPGHVFGEVTAVVMSETRSEPKYSYKNYFETRRKNLDFGRQNISMGRPTLDSTPFGTSTTNGKLHQLTRSLLEKNVRPHATDMTRKHNQRNLQDDQRIHQNEK